MSDSFDDRSDNLVEFLIQFTRFGIEQCADFTRLLTTLGNFSAIEKQRVIPAIVSPFFFRNNFFPKIQLSSEIEHLETELHRLLPLINSSDDPSKQLLFVKLQTYLSNLLDIHFRFKSLTHSTTLPTTLPVHRQRYFSTNSSLSNLPLITISSPSDVGHELIDIGKCWKFANIIPTRFPMSLIASNAREVLCYNNQNHFLHVILITGQALENIKWHFDFIVDLLW